MSNLGNIRKALDLAAEKLAKADTFGAVSIMHAAIEQILAYLQNIDMNNHPDSDVTIRFQEDCSEGDEK
tara:strand:- start:63 stop:269 length:207 start_codon:yes stop_codon:yes gene_type:complete